MEQHFTSCRVHDLPSEMTISGALKDRRTVARDSTCVAAANWSTRKTSRSGFSPPDKGVALDLRTAAAGAPPTESALGCALVHTMDRKLFKDRPAFRDAHKDIYDSVTVHIQAAPQADWVFLREVIPSDASV